MKRNGKNTVPGEETEEIFLDEEEFEELLAENVTINEKDEIRVPLQAEIPDYEKDLDIDAGLFDEDTAGAESYGRDWEDSPEPEEEKEDLLEDEPVRVYRPGKTMKKAVREEADPDVEDLDDEEDAPIAHFFKDGVADKLIYLVGALIVLMLVIVGVIFATGKTRNAQTVDLASLGNNVAEIGVIGEDGINAVFGTKAAQLKTITDAAVDIGYDEIDEETGLVNVKLSLTSILRDLKIKFVNKNNKLVANVPFEVEVTNASGKTETYTDDDKDGIIYLSGIAGGDYKVKLKELSAYTGLYSFDTETASVDVKNEIEYVKVDVANEVKSDTDAAAENEDTETKDTETEGSLKDTVEFVLSTKTALNGDEGYTEISSSKITDPKKQYTSKDVTKTGTMQKLDVSNNDPEEITGFTGAPSSMKAGETANVTVNCSNSQVSNVTWTPSNTDAVSIEGNGSTGCTIKAKSLTADANVTVTCSVTFLSGTVSTSTFSFTVKGEDKSSFNFVPYRPSVFYPGQSYSLLDKSTVTVVDKSGKTITSGYTLSFSSSKKKVATIDDAGNIKAVKKGTTSITVTCTGDNITTQTASFDLTVSASSVVVKLNYSEKTIFLKDKETTTLIATVTGASVTGVDWSSDNEKVVKVASTGALTAVSEGTAVITATSIENETVYAECKVTVVLNPKDNTVKLLTDKDGNQVYVYDSSSKKYREATYADYYTASKFYIAGEAEYKYTGWWTLGGNTYYFDKNGNKVTGEQVILGTKYTFASDGTLMSGSGTFGIDVSKFNGKIDWGSVADSGVSYAILRCGFRGSTAGGLFEDSTFEYNAKNATANGIKIGVYFFTQATNEVEAVEEASMVLGQISNYTVKYPIFIDVESAGSGARAENLSASERTAVIKAFCKTIQNSGYVAGVYANKTWLSEKINTSDLTAYKIWLAQYATSVTYTKTRYDMWQYSDAGSLSGVSTKVDLDTSYMGY